MNWMSLINHLESRIDGYRELDGFSLAQNSVTTVSLNGNYAGSKFLQQDPAKDIFKRVQLESAFDQMHEKGNWTGGSKPVSSFMNMQTEFQ